MTKMVNLSSMIKRIHSIITEPYREEQIAFTEDEDTQIPPYYSDLIVKMTANNYLNQRKEKSND